MSPDEYRAGPDAIAESAVDAAHAAAVKFVRRWGDPVPPRAMIRRMLEAAGSLESPPLPLPADESDLVRTVSPFLMAQRLQKAEAKLAAVGALCDSIAAEVPEGETATVPVSRVLAIIGSEGDGRG